MLNYVTYVVLCPTCLLQCVLWCHKCLVPYLLSCSTCSRASRASCCMYSHASRISCPPYSCAPRVLCRTAFVPDVLRASRAWCSLWPRTLYFMSPFSLCTLLSCTLRTLCPNTTFCAILMKNLKSYLDGRIGSTKIGLLFFVH